MAVPLIGYVTLYHLASYFFIYGFLGWIAEVIYATLKTGKFVNRGFLNGPICPIYGVGTAVAILLLNPFEKHWWLLIIAGGALATLLEFITGFVLDKIFKTKWWDYSEEPFNIKGYVCLKFTILWGIGILLIFKTIVPLVNALVALVPLKWAGMIILSTASAIFIADFVCVVFELKNLSKSFKEMEKISAVIKKGSDFIGEKISDGTVSVTARVKILTEKIKKSRLVKAFPRLGEKRNRSDEEEEKERNERLDR